MGVAMVPQLSPGSQVLHYRCTREAGSPRTLASPTCSYGPPSAREPPGLRADGVPTRRWRAGLARAQAVEDEGERPEAAVDVEARLGLGRRARKQQRAAGPAGPAGPAGGGGPSEPPQKAKAWEAMSLPEKAWALYIDPEKGMLFWLNKLAYASIFVLIGSWIVFRFIGPALGWYELEQPLLPPDKLLG